MVLNQNLTMLRLDEGPGQSVAVHNVLQMSSVASLKDYPGEFVNPRTIGIAQANFTRDCLS